MANNLLTPAAAKQVIVGPDGKFTREGLKFFNALLVVAAAAQGALQAANNLSDLPSNAAAIANLIGYTPANATQIGSWASWTISSLTCTGGGTVTGLSVAASKYCTIGPITFLQVRLNFTVTGNVTQVSFNLPPGKPSSSSSEIGFAGGLFSTYWQPAFFAIVGLSSAVTWTAGAAALPAGTVYFEFSTSYST